MRASQIEAWAIRVLDAVQTGQANEDDRVELKALWPEDNKAARRIAGHANSMRGEFILWLIGVDEKQATVEGAPARDPAEWWTKVSAQFDGVAPVERFINVPWNGKTVVALALETDRAPYVVKNPEFGVVQGLSPNAKSLGERQPESGRRPARKSCACSHRS